MEMHFRPLSDGDAFDPNSGDYGDRVFEVLANHPVPSGGDTSQSAFDWAFLSDVEALHAHSRVKEFTRGLTKRAMHFAAFRMVVGGGTLLLSKEQVLEICLWYTRRIATRMVDVMMYRKPEAYDEADARTMLVFRTHADMSTALELDSDGKVRRATLKDAEDP